MADLGLIPSLPNRLQLDVIQTTLKMTPTACLGILIVSDENYRQDMISSGKLHLPDVNNAI